MTASREILQRWERSVMHTYGTPPVALVRGSGARVWDADGVEYVDMVAGIAVNAVGHAHPRVIEAMTRQLSTLGHTSNLAATLPSIELAERLLALSGQRDDGRIFFCNSGAEANEAALKVARRTGRPEVVVASGAFHGRTMGALSWTAQPAKQLPFLPLPGEVSVVPFGDADAIADAVSDRTAAVVLEPIQGEGGVIVPPEGYLAEVARLCRERGALFILDEVQTGVGRTGWWFAHLRDGLEPDVMMLAKGLAGGMPIGACVAWGSASSLLTPGMHGSTFGGNPVNCAAALAVLDIIERERLLDRVSALEETLRDGLLAGAGPLAAGVRGRGLLLGVLLTGEYAGKVETAARAHGLLVNAIGGDVIRLAPPLTLTDEDVHDCLERWGMAMTDVRRDLETAP